MDHTSFTNKPRLVLPVTGEASPATSWMDGSLSQSSKRSRETYGPYPEDVAHTLISLRNTGKDKNRAAHGPSPVPGTSTKPSTPSSWYDEIDRWAASFEGRYYPTEYRLPLAGDERASFNTIWRALDAKLRPYYTPVFNEGQLILPTLVARSLIDAAQHQEWRDFRRGIRKLDRQIARLTPVRFLLPSELRGHSAFDRFHAFMSLVASHEGLMFAAGRTSLDEVRANSWTAAAHVQHLATKLLWDDHGRLLSLDDFTHRFWPVPIGPAQSPFYRSVAEDDDEPDRAYASSVSESYCDDTLSDISASCSGTEKEMLEDETPEDETPQDEKPESKTPRLAAHGVSERTQREKNRADYLDLPEIGMDAMVLCNHCARPGTRDKGSCRVSQNPHRKTVGRGFACKKCRKTKLNCSFIAIAKEVKKQRGSELLPGGAPQQQWQAIYKIQQARNEVAEARRQRKQP